MCQKSCYWSSMGLKKKILPLRNYLKQRIHGTRFVSNFDDANKYLFWTIIETETIHLLYDRKPKLYSEWDQLLGPLTLSKYDRMQFQFQCLKGFNYKKYHLKIKFYL